MPYKIHICAFSIVIFIIFQSCATYSNDSKELLLKAENCIVSYPDSALFYLGSILTPKMLDQDDYAKYAVLLVRVHSKANLSLLNDTIIYEAIDYYLKTNDDLNLSRAYLQAGRVEEERKDYIKARAFYLDAMKLAMKIGRNKLVAVCAIETAELSILIDNYSDALKWLNISIDYYIDNSEKQIILKKIADCYVLQNKPNDALKIYSELEVSLNNKCQNLLSDIYKNKSLLLYKNGNYQDANTCINRAIIFCDDDELFPIIYSLKADIFAKLNKPDSVYYCKQKAIDYAFISNRIDIIYTINNNSLNRDKIYLKAHDDFYWNIASESISNKSRYRTISALTNIFNQSKIQNQTQALLIRNQQYVIVIITTLLCLILISIIYAYSKKKMVKKHLLNIKINNDNFTSKEIELNEIIYHYQLSLEDKLLLYRRLVMLSLSENRKNDQILRFFNQIMYNKNELFHFNWDNLIELINIIYNDFQIKLIKKYSILLSEKEIEVILFQKAGFEVNEICEILQLSSTTIYHRNSDIRKKLNLGPAENFIEYLNKELLK